MKEKKSTITHEELQRAVSKFIKAGGIITQLPAERPMPQNRVGAKWVSTEIGSDLR